MRKYFGSPFWQVYVFSRWYDDVIHHETVFLNNYGLVFFNENRKIIELRVKFLIDQNMMCLELTGTVKDIVRSLGNCLIFFFQASFFKKQN